MHPIPRRRLSLLLAVALVAASAVPAVADVEGTLIADPDVLQGAHPSGKALLFSPDPVVPGSSVSHWDSSASPNVLMEPAINPDLPYLELDLTSPLLQDLGWQLGGLDVTFLTFDDPESGTGFFDPTPFAGDPGNPATTLGEARQIAFAAALDAWADTLESTVGVDVLAGWVELPCSQGAGVLAAATTTFIYRGFPGAPQSGVWYPAALTESVLGTDETGEDGDIVVFANSLIDTACLGPDTRYYYGLDGAESTTQVNAVTTLLHELGHGFGMQNFTNASTGRFAGPDAASPDGYPSAYDTFLEDQTRHETWDEMTVAERQASAQNFRNLVWNGDEVTEAVPDVLAPGTPLLEIDSPAEIAGSYPIGQASFGAPFPSSGLSGEIVCLIDGLADPTRFDGCSPAANPGALAGKIALIDRGNCGFTTKAANAQAAGAIAAIVANNAGDSAPGLGGTDATITIPVVSVGATTGARIRQHACGEIVDYLVGDRFQVTVDWDAHNGQSGRANSVPLTDAAGYWTFFDPDNVEVVLKVVDACTLPGFHNFWVFVAGLTNVEVVITVTDTQSGAFKQYVNENGNPFEAIQDTNAFATCP